MLCRFAYLLVRRYLDVLTGRFRSRLAKEAEIAVLRHQIEVLRRQVSRLDLEPADRAVLALLSRLLPRDRWSAFMVTPATILRWHRELVRRRWTYPKLGRPPLDDDISGPHPSVGEGEPAVGLPADRRRAPPPRHPRVCEHGPAGPASGRTRSGAAPERPELVDVPPSPGSRCAGL